jgi:hypothetical protein
LRAPCFSQVFDPRLGFLETLSLFVATAIRCKVIPGYELPTGSLSTTAALKEET